MEFLRSSSEAEMVLTFLRAEIGSQRFRGEILAALDALSLTEAVVTGGDSRNAYENEKRAQVLEHYRDYLSGKGLFARFPKEIDWQWVHLTPEERRQIRYINYDYWIELSGGTRLPEMAAENIGNGITVFGITHDHMPAQAEALDLPGLPPVIVLCGGGDMIVLEGHIRLTLMALAGERIGGIDVLAGFCSAEALRRWDTPE